MSLVRIRFLPLAAAVALSAIPALAVTKMVVTVVEQKTGQAITDLKAADFIVLDDRTPRRVESAEYTTTPVDVMLLLDTSLVGHMVQPVAADLIARLDEKEQMAIVSFHSSADLIQDFTASKDLLRRAVAGVKYGNEPRLLDAIFAAADGGFESASYRRVILLLTSGAEGNSRVSERGVIRLARKKGISVFPVYMLGYERSMFESLARQTGGALFSIRELGRNSTKPPAERAFNVLRGSYTLTLSGNLALGEKVKVEVSRPQKLFVSALPLE